MAELKTGLVKIYGSRLKGLYLFGSYARGEQDSESDVDVLVVLEDFTSYFAEVERAGHLGAELSLKYGVSVSKVFMREEAWLHKETPFLLNVREEAIAA
jgi:predicted nucleotidyltransferase